MAVYILIDIEIKNSEIYSDYVEQVYKVINFFNGRYLVMGGNITLLTGSWLPERIVIIEFPTPELLRQCFKSPEYKALSPLRKQSTSSRAIVVEGFMPGDTKINV